MRISINLYRAIRRPFQLIHVAVMIIWFRIQHILHLWAAYITYIYYRNSDGDNGDIRDKFRSSGGYSCGEDVNEDDFETDVDSSNGDDLDIANIATNRVSEFVEFGTVNPSRSRQKAD